MGVLAHALLIQLCVVFFVFFGGKKKTSQSLNPWFGILGFQMNCFFGGRVLEVSCPFLQNATQKEEEDHRNHGTKPGSIERGRLRRVLEQSGNHGFVSAGRVERDGEENRRRVVRRDGVRDRAARRDGDVRGFVCRRRRLVVCFLPGFGGALFFYAGEVSFAGGVVSLPFLSLPSVVPSRRLSARREAGK